MLSGILFYLDGFDDITENGIDAEIDIGPIAKAVLAAGTGAALLEQTRAAATAVIRKADAGPERAEWIEANEDEIEDFGGDASKAWDQYQQGRIEALRLQVQDTVIEELDNILDEMASNAADEAADEEDEEDAADEDGHEEEEDA